MQNFLMIGMVRGRQKIWNINNFLEYKLENCLKYFFQYVLELCHCVGPICKPYISAVEFYGSKIRDPT